MKPTSVLDYLTKVWDEASEPQDEHDVLGLPHDET